MTEAQAALRQAIAAIEAQRAVLGDTVTNAALAPLQARLAADQALQHQQQQQQQHLRQVTVLFLDIVGSTSLTQRLDPEEVHAVMDGALEAFAAVVTAHGGRVLQFAGDSLLAAFGAEGAHEDDAARAVHAGLALLARGAQVGREVQAAHGHEGLNVRVGVHTGRVLLGGGVDDEGTIRGMTVNVAARLEQAAPPGALRISHDTWRHVQGLFVARVQPALQVKGRDEPLLSYLVDAAVPGAVQAHRGLDGVHTPLLGRDAELADLLAAFDDVQLQGRARACTVIGEAGLGKSRLVQEVQQHLQARVAVGAAGSARHTLTVLLARAHPAHQMQPYRLLRDMLAAHLQVVDSDSAETARRRLCEGLAPAFAGQGDAPLHAIGQLIGLDFSDSPHIAHVDPRDLRKRALAALDHWLQALAAEHRGPLLLVAEDLHWSDDVSLDLLLQWMAGPLPILLLATARPTLLERRPGWAEGLAGHRRLLLDGLGGDASTALAAALLQRMPQVPAELLQLLTHHADGNPYYMEELLKMLIDDGVVGTDGGVWQVQAQQLARVQLPTTLVGVLQARLDSLAEGERQALQQAAIVGSVFWDEALAALDDQAPQQLPGLHDKALVQAREGSAFEGTTEENFRHHLLQQVAYDTVLKVQRRRGHAAAARWLAHRVAGRASEHLATTAQHFLQAGELEEAARWLADAADHAADRFDNINALALARRALEVLQPGQTELQVRLLCRVIKLVDLMADRSAQGEAIRQLLTVAAQPAAPPRWAAHAQLTQATWQFRTGKHEDAERSAQTAVETALAAGEDLIAAEGFNLRVVMARLRGDQAAARQHGLAGLQIARRCRAPSFELRLQGNLGLCDFELGHLESARDALAGSLALARVHGPEALLPVLMANLAAIHVQMADYTVALRWAEDGIAAGTLLGDRVHTLVAQLNQSQALWGLGNCEHRPELVERACEIGAQCVEGLQAAQSFLLEAVGRELQGDIELALGRLEASLANFQAAERRYEALGQAPGRLNALAGVVYLRSLIDPERPPAEWLADLAPVLERLRDCPPHDPVGGNLRTRLLVYHLLARAGHVDAALLLKQAQATLQDSLDRFVDPALRDQYQCQQTHVRELHAVLAGIASHTLSRPPACPAGAHVAARSSELIRQCPSLQGLGAAATD